MNSSKALKGAARSAVRKGGAILTAAFTISFFVNVLRLAGPMFMILIYDRVLSSRSVETLISLFVVLVGFMLILGTLDYARKRLLARFGARFQEQMEDVLFTTATRNEMFQHNKTKPSVGLDEVDGLRGFFHSNSLISIFDFIWAPMFITVVFILHPKLGWVCMGGVGVMILMTIAKAVFMGARQENANASSGLIGKLKNMLLVSRETVRGQDMNVGYKDRWQVARNDARDKAIALNDWTGWFDSMSRVLVMIVRYSVLATGAYLTLKGELTVGAMVAATFMVTRVLGPISSFLNQIPRIIQARAHWVRLQAILANRALEMEDSYKEQPGVLSRLVLSNVSVKSPVTNQMILRSVSVTISAGELIEINGVSSQGKTVLAETILGMWNNASGTILVNGRNVARLSDIDAETMFGYCPESPSFIDGTIEENIARLERNPDPSKVGFAARRARFHAAICALPDGYQTMLDARGSCLSTFERQQLSLARAIYHDPDVLIIDGLDTDMLTRIPKRLQTTFSGLMERGVSIIVLSRNQLNLPDTKRQFELKDGRLSEITKVAAARPSNVAANSSGNAASKVSVLRSAKAEEKPKSKAARN